MFTFKHAKEFLRYIRNFQFEYADTGILFPKASVIAKGVFHDSVNGAPFQFAGHNLIVDQGLIYMLKAAMTEETQPTDWYVAPFNGPATVLSTWTAANFAANATELTTEYTEATRPVWTPDAVDTGAISVDNDTAPATYTINGSVTVTGAGLLSSNVKAGTGGILAAASRFTASRTLADADAYSLRYGIDFNTP